MITFLNFFTVLHSCVLMSHHGVNCVHLSRPCSPLLLLTLSVASCVLPAAELGGGMAVASLCVLVHASVAEASERYFQELRRR